MLAVSTALILGPLLCYGFAAFIFAVLAAAKAEDAAFGDIVVYVRGNATHTEFVLPESNRIMDWSHVVPAEDFGSPPANTTHLSFGWGEREFYLLTPRWSDLDWAVGLNALSYSDTTVLHVYRLSSIRGYRWIRRLMLSEKQYKRLVDYILSSYRMVDRMPVAVESAAYGAGDAFYEASGTYSPFMTCNEWINRGLRSAGLNNAFWSPFSFGVKWALAK